MRLRPKNKYIVLAILKNSIFKILNSETVREILERNRQNLASQADKGIICNTYH